MLKANLWFRSSCLVCVSAALISCAGKPKQADDSFEYLKAKPAKSIQVPAELDKIDVDSPFDIDLEAELAGNLGKNISIFPPRLIAPIVTASHIDEIDPRTSIWFEQTEHIDNLHQAIWNAVKGYLAKSEVKIEKFDEVNQVLESGWFVQQREFGWWLWSGKFDLERQKYRFKLEMKPHGRSGKLTVELIKREPLLEIYPDYDVADNQGLATEKLNAVAGHFEYRLRLDAENRRTQYVKGVTSNLGQAENGDPAIIIDASYEHSWIRVLEALDHYELILTDINKLQGRIYARVKSDNSGFWSGLFGSESESFGLKKGDYVIELLRNGEQTHLIFNDITLDSLDKKQLEKIFPHIAERLAEDLE